MDNSGPLTIETPLGDIDFNTGADGFYLNGDGGIRGFDGGAVRLTVEDRPQASGSNVRKPRRKGVAPTFAGYILSDAAGSEQQNLEQRQAFADELRGKLNSINADAGSEGRVVKTVTGFEQARILDRVRLSQEVRIEDGLWVKTFSFGLVSRFPYLLDEQETETVIADGDAATLDNTGDADMFPVFKVYDLGSDLTLTNGFTGATLGFSGLSGYSGGDYLEIDCFRRTAFKNGTGADELGKLDPDNSDFLWLASGPQSVLSAGGEAHVLWQPAWVGA